MTSAPASLADTLRAHPTVRIGDDIEPAWREQLTAWAGARGLRVSHPDATLAITTQPDQALHARWVHSPFAGVEHLAPTLSDGVLLTRTTGTMPGRIAEYVLTWVLAERWQAARYLGDSATGTWDPSDPPTAPSRGDAVVVGTGAMGAAIARALAGTGHRVVGLSRSGRPDEAFDAVLPLADVRDMSVRDMSVFDGSRVDVLVLALPHTAQTIGVIDSELLKAFEGVHLVNIGRGSAVGTSTLLEALETGSVRHATLDVTEQEPLGPSSPLWRRRDVTITPHISGRTLPSDVVESLDAALTQVRAGALPASAVVRELGY